MGIVISIWSSPLCLIGVLQMVKVRIYASIMEIIVAILVTNNELIKASLKDIDLIIILKSAQLI